MELLKDQIKIIPRIGANFRAEQAKVMENVKATDRRVKEAREKLAGAGKAFSHINVQFRTMDKDINTVRPELMKLQWEKEQYFR